VGCTGAGKHAIEEVLNPFRPVLDTFRLQTNIIDRLVHFRGIVCMVGGDEGGEGHMHVFCRRGTDHQAGHLCRQSTALCAKETGGIADRHVQHLVDILEVPKPALNIR
jgi:hypothetical protein